MVEITKKYDCVLTTNIALLYSTGLTSLMSPETCPYRFIYPVHLCMFVFLSHTLMYLLYFTGIASIFNIRVLFASFHVSIVRNVARLIRMHTQERR